MHNPQTPESQQLHSLKIAATFHGYFRNMQTGNAEIHLPYLAVLPYPYPALSDCRICPASREKRPSQ